MGKPANMVARWYLYFVAPDGRRAYFKYIGEYLERTAPEWSGYKADSQFYESEDLAKQQLADMAQRWPMAQELSIGKTVVVL